MSQRASRDRQQVGSFRRTAGEDRQQAGDNRQHAGGDRLPFGGSYPPGNSQPPAGYTFRMDRRRNFLPLLGFLVCALGFGSYFFFFYRFPITRDVPWANWLLFALGLGIVGFGIRRPFRQPERYRGRWWSPILGVLSLAFVGFFLFMTLVVSRELPVSAGAPKVGEKVPDFTLPDASGRPVHLYDLLGTKPGGQASWVLLIFYRGYW
ncbi:MAG TPA: hypothetical protein VMM92_14015 [Thermoanaerobaculia bacterium]|nr:hypothetical protein [Thermoanaerobaculia bacterium]